MGNLGYNTPGVIAMAKLDEALKIANEMSIEELKALHDAVVRMLATPLQNPRDYFDDWDDEEVDRMYEEIYRKLCSFPYPFGRKE